MEIELSSDITWMKRVEKQFNDPKTSASEQLLMLCVLETRLKNTLADVDVMKTRVQAHALRETREKMIERSA